MVEKKFKEIREKNIIDSDFIDNGKLVDLDYLLENIEKVKSERRKIIESYLIGKKWKCEGYMVKSELVNCLCCLYNNLSCNICVCLEGIEYSKEEIKEELKELKINNIEMDIIMEELKELLNIKIK